MNPLTWLHIGAGAVALVAGTIAVAARKGDRWHRRAGTGFVVAMGVLGISASLLAPFAEPVQSPLGGIMVVYFVGTGWLAAHRRATPPGWFERIACGFMLFFAVATLWVGVQRALGPAGQFTAPPRPGALIAIGTVCLLAGLGDLRLLVRRTLTPRQRIGRHLWRMCFALFIATGSFFLGQMDVLPASLRHLPTLLVLGFAPIAVMLFALARQRISGYPLARSPRVAPAPPLPGEPT